MLQIFREQVVHNDTPTDTPICQAASVALVKVGTYDDGDCTAAVGDVITYAFSVSNTGNVTLSNVIVEDPLVTMLGGPIASLAPGAIDTTTYTASYTITQQDIDAGVFSNQATVQQQHHLQVLMLQTYLEQV